MIKNLLAPRFTKVIMAVIAVSFGVLLYTNSRLLLINSELIEMNTQLLDMIEEDEGVQVDYRIPLEDDIQGVYLTRR